MIEQYVIYRSDWRRIEVVITGLTRNQLVDFRLAGSNPAVSAQRPVAAHHKLLRGFLFQELLLHKL